MSIGEGSPGSFESTNLSGEILTREIGRNDKVHGARALVHAPVHVRPAQTSGMLR